MSDSLRTKFSRFPRVFWVVQTFEMLERGAYYTMVPILVIHAHFNLGFSPWLAASLFAFMYPFQYGLPIFTGALAEKVGYRKQMIFAFSFLTVAYILLFLAFNIITMILAIMAVGIGIGSYKPLVSSTIAKCTASKDRNIAYGIYYWIVNLAACLFPIIFVIFEIAGYLPRSSYNFVFLVGGVMVSLNIFTAIFIFKEVPRSGKVKTVGDAINNIRTALSDKKFLVMVVLIGGFWAQYATMLFAIQLIGFGYHWFPLFITAMVLGIPNPLTIIALGPFISKFIEKIESMRVILGGLVVYIIGLIIIGFSLQHWELIITGIIICSIGEFMVAPGYMAFVSKLAPKENISAYIGCNFISYMIGLLGGTLVFGFIVAYVGVDLRMPYFFYGILISFALMLFFAFVIYYRTWGQDVIERAKKIKELEEGEDKDFGIPSDYKEPFFYRIFDLKITAVVPLLLIPVVIFGAYSFGTFHYYGVEEDVTETPFSLDDYISIPGGSFAFDGSLQESQSDTETVTIYIGEGEHLEEGELLKSITFELTWEDEANEGPNGIWVNQPDEFSMTVSEGENFMKTDSGENPPGGEGSIPLTFEFGHDSAESINGTGKWTIEVTLVSCGGFLNPRFTDTSNDYDLVVTTEVYKLE